MEDINLILANKYPKTKELKEDQFVYLEDYGITKLDYPSLEEKTKLVFYKTKFFIQKPLNQYLDVVIGLSPDNQVYLVINPMLSNKYSNLVNKLEEIKNSDVSNNLLAEIISMF